MDKHAKRLPALPVSVVAKAMLVVWERKLAARVDASANDVIEHDAVVSLGTAAAAL